MTCGSTLANDSSSAREKTNLLDAQGVTGTGEAGQESNPSRMSQHQRVILVLVFVDMLAVGLVVPFITPLIKQLGANPMQLGLLSSSYGALQLISSPVLGLVSDRRGRRLVMLLSYAGTAVSYLIMGLGTNLEVVVLARLVVGLLKHSSNASKAYVVDYTTHQERAVELGRIATASGLGMMVGPVLGGFLFKAGGAVIPGGIASSLYFVNCFLLLKYLPPPGRSRPSSKHQSAAPSSSHEGSSKDRAVQHLPVVTMPWRARVAGLCVVRLLVGLAVQLHRQGLVMLLLYRFSLGVQTNGLLISFQALISAVVQGFAIGPLVLLFDDAPLILRGQCLLAASYAACALSPTIWSLAVMLTPLALAAGAVRTTFTAVLTSAVPSSEVGQLLGLTDALTSACRVIGPGLAGVLADKVSLSAPGLCSCALMLVAAVVFCATSGGLTVKPASAREKERAASSHEMEKPLLSSQSHELPLYSNGQASNQMSIVVHKADLVGAPNQRTRRDLPVS